MNEQQQRVLSAGLKKLAEASRNESASRRVEQAVMEEARRVMLRPGTSIPRPAVDRRWLPLAAALALAVGGALWTARTNVPIAVEGNGPLSGFVALPSAYGLPDMESASIIRVSLPLSALPTYGLSIMPDASGDSVEADLLVAQDGQPRAIRLVNEPQNSRSRP